MAEIVGRIRAGLEAQAPGLVGARRAAQLEGMRIVGRGQRQAGWLAGGGGRAVLADHRDGVVAGFEGDVVGRIDQRRQGGDHARQSDGSAAGGRVVEILGRTCNRQTDAPDLIVGGAAGELDGGLDDGVDETPRDGVAFRMFASWAMSTVSGSL